MSNFQNILVAVDLTRSEATGIAALDPVAQNTVRHALWVARACHARVTFFSVVSRPAPRDQAVHHSLAGLVGQANVEGVSADAVQVSGQVWLEITRKVIHDESDLLVVGTNDPRGLRRLVLGSTARKLLHECPCPVWVCKARGGAVPRNILVASDLSPLSDGAVRLGLTLGHLAGAHTHILDVVEFPLDRLRSSGAEDAATRKYHDRIRIEADQALHAQAERVGGRKVDPTISIHVADGNGVPDDAIEAFITDHVIDVLVLGTVARHGLSGVLRGNTAERLLPQVPCSVLAVKSPNFHCVVSAEDG
jgi:universal stress protein E